MRAYNIIRIALTIMLTATTAIETLHAKTEGEKTQKPSPVDIWQGIKGMKKVEMTPYTAEGKNNIAVIICPGGSYYWHSMKAEGSDVAKWLNKNGIAAFVLKYRTAKWTGYAWKYRLITRGTRYPDAQDDLRQATRYIKKHAEKYGMDTAKIGLMGFSAGGHLVASATELFEQQDMPKFIAPIYPVVTMTEECVHKKSRRGLLGDNKTKDEKMKDSLSIERHIKKNCPPVFLMNCKDDPIVDYRNSELLDSALTKNRIEHKYIQYQTGGHGFGASEEKGTEECRQWKTEFERWIVNLYPELRK